MKIKFLSIALCVIIFFNSCGSKKKDLSDILSFDCYWDIIDIGSLAPLNSCYKFDKLGGCKYYNYHFFDKKRTDSVYLFDDDDVIVPNKWKIVNDSIIIRANKYHVISYNSDSIVLTATGKNTMILKKNCKTLHPRSR